MFDTYNVSRDDSTDLALYLQHAVRNGAVLVGVTGDEPMSNLAPALSTLRAAGVYVGDVRLAGSFAFVVQKGCVHKTVYIKTLSNIVSAVKLDVRISG